MIAARRSARQDGKCQRRGYPNMNQAASKTTDAIGRGVFRMPRKHEFGAIPLGAVLVFDATIGLESQCY
jgi:hypothetical protein